MMYFFATRLILNIINRLTFIANLFLLVRTVFGTNNRLMVMVHVLRGGTISFPSPGDTNPNDAAVFQPYYRTLEID